MGTGLSGGKEVSSWKIVLRFSFWGRYRRRARIREELTKKLQAPQLSGSVRTLMHLVPQAVRVGSVHLQSQNSVVAAAKAAFPMLPVTA